MTVERKLRILREYAGENMPKLVKNIDMCFPGRLWSNDKYEIDEQDLSLLFDCVNDGLFDNGIDRNFDKLVAVFDPRDPAVACFSGGMVNGAPRIMIAFKQVPGVETFFQHACTVIHEAIHAYDYAAGPIHAMLAKYGRMRQLNWGRAVGVRDALHAAGLRPGQIPAGMPYDLFDQYAFPDVDAEKFRLGDDGMYDVHGWFFNKHAGEANKQGFDVAKHFNPKTAHRTMAPVAESRDEDPEDVRYMLDPSPVRRLYDTLASGRLVAFKYVDDKNWMLSIE